jgi:hypothetical protein
MSYVAVACRVLIGLVFLTSVVHNGASPARFRVFATWLGTLSTPAAKHVKTSAIGFLAVEGAIVIMVALPWTAALGGVLAALVLGCFIVEIALLLREGVDVPCSCFGASRQLLGAPTLARDGFLLLSTMPIAIFGSNPVASGAPIALSIGIGIVGAALVVASDDLAPLLMSRNDSRRVIS